MDSKQEHKDAIEVSVIFYEGQRMFAVPKQPAPVETVPNAMQTVIGAMQADPGYAWSWHCNVAMAFVDAGGDHYTANQGAALFMRLLANVEPAHELPSPHAQPAPVSNETMQKLREKLESPSYTHALAYQNIREALEIVMRWIDDYCETGPENDFERVEKIANAALEYTPPAAPVHEDWGPGPHEYHSLPAPVRPVAWIDCKVQMPPPGVRVFFLHKDHDRVGFDTWFGDDFRWTPSHWMPIPPLTTTPSAQPAPEVTNLAAAIEYADARWSGVDVPIEWARHFADAIGKPYTTPPAQPAPVQDASKQFHEWAVSEHAAQPAPVQVIPILNNPDKELRWGADGFWSLHYADTLIRFLGKYERNFVDSAIAAAQLTAATQPAPVQEPVAWRYDLAKYRENDLRGRQWAHSVFSPTKPYINEMVRNLTPLYATPPAQPAPVQEPVGNWVWSWLMDWCKRNGIAPATRDSLFAMVKDARNKFEATPLTAQPAAQEFTCSTGLCHYKAQRQWAGLTAGERDALFTQHYQWDDYGKAIETKLMEKNT